MVEIITGVTLAARVVFYIASYRGYKAESKKEDDRAIRNWIMESINGLRNHAVNLMETGYRNDDDNLESEAKVMIDNIEKIEQLMLGHLHGWMKVHWYDGNERWYDNPLPDIKEEDYYY